MNDWVTKAWNANVYKKAWPITLRDAWLRHLTDPLTRLLQFWYLGLFDIAHKPNPLRTDHPYCISHSAKTSLLIEQIQRVGWFTQQLVRGFVGKHSCFFTLMHPFQLLLSSMVYKNNRAGHMCYCINRRAGWRRARFDWHLAISSCISDQDACSVLALWPDDQCRPSDFSLICWWNTMWISTCSPPARPVKKVSNV